MAWLPFAKVYLAIYKKIPGNSELAKHSQIELKCEPDKGPLYSQEWK